MNRSASEKSRSAMRTASLSVLSVLMKLRILLALVAVTAFFGLTAPNFLTAANFLIMFKHIAIIAILAIGMMYVVLTGGIDLSVGSVAGLSGMIAGALILNGLKIDLLGIVIYPSALETVGIALVAGGVIGLINGTLVTRFGVAPFIATLGMLYVARGTAMLMSGGATFPNLVGLPEYGNQGFPWLGEGTILGVPVSICILAILAIAAAYVSRQTVFGRQIYAVGGNERAARLSGVRVDRVKIATYTISGVCAALVGLIVASDLVAAHPASGESFELSAIAAVVLGGASLAGGRGTMEGALVGACVIGILMDGMVMIGLSEFWQMVAKGVVIVVAVMLDQAQRRIVKA
jgi:erythritol transport system permease protein